MKWHFQKLNNFGKIIAIFSKICLQFVALVKDVLSEGVPFVDKIWHKKGLIFKSQRHVPTQIILEYPVAPLPPPPNPNFGKKWVYFQPDPNLVRNWVYFQVSVARPYPNHTWVVSSPPPLPSPPPRSVYTSWQRHRTCQYLRCIFLSDDLQHSPHHITHCWLSWLRAHDPLAILAYFGHKFSCVSPPVLRHHPTHKG